MSEYDNDDAPLTAADFERLGRELLLQVPGAQRQGREAADAALTPGSTPVTTTDAEILLVLVKAERRHSDPDLNELAARKAIDADPAGLRAKYAEQVAAERVRLQAVADRDAEREQANSLEGRAAAAKVAARSAERKTERAREYAALLTHEGQLPPGGLELLSEDEIIALGQKPRERSPIEVADPMHAGRPPGANQRPVPDDANDIEANDRRANPEKYAS